MQSVTLVGFLAVVVLIVIQAPKPASAVCCRAPGSILASYFTSGTVNVGGNGGGAALRYHLCNDCTRPTPYCAHGRCNIFGCNCDGGCRQGRCERRRRSIQGEDYPTNSGAEEILVAGDLNADGKLSMSEARRLLRANGVTVERGALRGLDTDHDGKLSSEEIDSTD